MVRLVWNKLPQSKEKRRTVSEAEWIKLIISTGFLILVMFSFSIGLTFYQRWFLQQYTFPFTTIMLHLIIKYLIATLFRRIFQCVTGKKRTTLSWSTSFLKLAPIGFSAALDIGFSNCGLVMITISLYTMTKSTSIIFILLFAILLKLETQTWGVSIIVFMISGGLFLFTYESTQFNFAGFVLVLLASLISGIRWTLTQFIITQSNLDLRNPIDMMYHVQLWMFLLMAPFSFIFEGNSLKSFFANSNQIAELIILIVTGALIAFALEITEFLVIIHTSSLTFAVSGIVKEICTLVLAYEWNGDKMTLVNFFGLLMCLGGIIGHVFFKARCVENSRKKLVIDDTSAMFLPILNDSSDEENGNFDDDSSTEVLFNVLQIGDKQR